MATIKKLKSKLLVRLWKIGTLLVDMYNKATAMETHIELTKKIKNRAII